MSTALKWILGIIIGLLVVAVVVSVGFFAFTRFGGGGLNGAYYGHMWGGGRHMPYYPMPNYGNPGRNLPQAPYRGFPGFRLGFLPLGGIGLALICLIFLGLVIGGIIALVNSSRRSASRAAVEASATPTVAATSAATVPGPAPATAEATVAQRNCPNCGRTVNEDWGHCPYCGADLSQPPADEGSA